MGMSDQNGQRAMWDQIAALGRRFAEIEAEMASPAVARDAARLRELAKERARLEPLVSLLAHYEKNHADLEEARQINREADDPELAAMARAEVETLTASLDALGDQAKRTLLPKDPNDERNVIIEIRAGTGGDEAGLWAGDLYRAYTRYAEGHGWRVDVISLSENAAGGFKEIVFEVRGKGAFSRLKYERGGHRVQRVPRTEAQGRIHTSTATVAVLPEAKSVDVEINEGDVRVDRFHSGGAGGQNVNKVETGIRLTHAPSGIVVTCSDERSQLKNRQKAIRVLRARLYDLAQREQEAERAQARRTQVGSGQRAEKIRTYNFPENRVTDHRIGLTTHNLHLLLEGQLDALIDAVATAEEAKMFEQQVA